MQAGMRKRPFLVSVFAFGLLVFGFVALGLLVLAVVFIYGPGAGNLSSPLWQDFRNFLFQDLRFFGMRANVLTFILVNGAFSIVLGYGLWKLKKWGWWLYMVWEIGGAILNIISHVGDLNVSWLPYLLTIPLFLYYFVTRRRHFGITTNFGINVDLSRYLPTYLTIYASPELKAGVVAGILWSPFLMINLNDLTPELVRIYANHPEYVPIMWSILVGGSIIEGALAGAMLGFIFGRVRSNLPGRSTLAKALFLAVALWLPITYLTILDGSFSHHLYDLSRNLVGNLFAGVLFSYFLRRWSTNATA